MPSAMVGNRSNRKIEIFTGEGKSYTNVEHVHLHVHVRNDQTVRQCGKAVSVKPTMQLNDTYLSHF